MRLMHQWSTIPGFDAQRVRLGIASAYHCLICGSRRMAWQDGVNTVHHYATDSRYLGLSEPECTEVPSDFETSTPPPSQPALTMTTATIRRIEEKVQAMIGQTFLFMQDKNPHTILKYDLRNNRLIISSNHRMFNFEAKNALKLLEAFRPVEEPDAKQVRDEVSIQEAKTKADDIFEGVKAMAQGHVPEQPEAVEVPDKPKEKTIEKLYVESMENAVVEEMKELAEAVVDKAREMGVTAETELPAQAEGKSLSDRPWPVALYRMLTPIVSDYEKAMDRVRHYREAQSINNPIYLHRDAGAVDAELAEQIYTLAIERAQQELQDTEKEFRQVIVDYIGITREILKPFVDGH